MVVIGVIYPKTYLHTPQYFGMTNSGDRALCELLKLALSRGGIRHKLRLCTICQLLGYKLLLSVKVVAN